jgi:hypothetical protein
MSLSNPAATIMIREMQSTGPEADSSEKKSQRSISFLNRRDLIRAALYVSASALTPGLSFAQAIESGLTAAARGEDGSKFLSDPNWKPLFLNDHQNQTLIVLGDLVIPTTDTPGAKEALVNRFLDLVLSVESADFRRKFVDALAFIDNESQTRFSKDFRDLAAEDQIWLLSPWAYAADIDRWIEEESKPDAGREHFLLLKGLIAEAYYGSEIGFKELGWDGEFTHGPYQGCEHQDEHT